MPSDANRVAIRYSAAESTYGTKPGGNWTNLRLVNESLRQDTTVINSAEIRSDRQISDIVRSQIMGAGDLNFELSYSEYDTLLNWALLSSAWVAGGAVSMGASTSFTAGSDTYNVAAASGTPFAGMAGQWLRIASADNAANNGICKINAVNNGGLDVDVIGNGDGATDTGDTNAVVTELDQIVNGTSFNSFSIEREYTDAAAAADQWEVFTGVGIESWAMNFAADALVTGTFGFIAQDAASAGATSGGTPTGPTTNEIMAAVDDVTKILEGTTYVELDATNLTWSLTNNLRGRFNIGDLGTSSIGTGTCEITGTFQAYYETKALADKHLAFTESSLAIVCQDTAGNTYVFDFPRIQFTSGQRVAGGINTDVISDMGFTAFRDTTEDVTVRIARVAA